MIRVEVITLGCSKNTVDSEKIKFYLLKNNFQIVSSNEKVDIVIINTCGFIQDAKKESIDTILNYTKLKEKYNNLKIVIIGCLAQRYAQIIAQEIPEVDGIIGLNYYNNLADILKRIYNGERIIKISNPNNLKAEKFGKRILETPSHYAYLKIAEGCSNFCSYCSIPLIKGKYRSRNIEDIIKEAKYLVNLGVRELIIIAQDTTYYGKDIYGKPQLATLLRKLVQINDLEWIRLLYCYPTNITDELINIIADEDKICKYLDIPLQHINPDILKRMGRNHSPEQIEYLISKLRSKIKDITLRTTFIVGFPGETDEHFYELLNFIKKIKFDWAGFFKYSREEGTPAAKMKSQVPDEIINERYNKAVNLQKSISQEKNQKFIGQTLSVLIEGKSECFQELYEGRSYRNAPDIDGIIYIKGENLMSGDIKECKIKNVYDYDLLGEVK